MNQSPLEYSFLSALIRGISAGCRVVINEYLPLRYGLLDKDVIDRACVLTQGS